MKKMKTFLPLAFAALLCILSSCTDYEEKAAEFIRSQNIRDRVILRKTESSPRMVIYAKASNVLAYNLKTEEITPLIKLENNISGWEISDGEEYSIIAVYSESYGQKYGIATRLDYLSGNVRAATMTEGEMIYHPTDEKALIFTGVDHRRTILYLSSGYLANIPTVGEYLTENQIHESRIWKIYDDSRRNCLFYDEPGFLDSDFKCYNALTGDVHHYSDCSLVYGESDDGESIFITTRSNGEAFLKKIDIISSEESIIARGSTIERYSGGFLVKKYDLTEEYYDGDGFRAEKPNRGIIGGLIDFLFG